MNHQSDRATIKFLHHHHLNVLQQFQISTNTALTSLVSSLFSVTCLKSEGLENCQREKKRKNVQDTVTTLHFYTCQIGM